MAKRTLTQVLRSLFTRKPKAKHEATQEELREASLAAEATKARAHFTVRSF